MAITIQINGEAITFDAPLTVDAILAHFELDPKKVAIEHNLAILPHSSYGHTTLMDKDAIEIVHFIGGG